MPCQVCYSIITNIFKEGELSTSYSIVNKTLHQFLRPLLRSAVTVLLASIVSTMTPMATGTGQLISVDTVQAASARTLSFSAKLKDPETGAVVSDGTYTVTFRVFTSETGGTAAWTEDQTITTQSGTVVASLGSVTAFPSTLNFAESAYYLEIAINGATLTPRKRIESVPSALSANTLEGKSVGTSANNILALDTSGNLAIAGTFAGSGLTLNPASAAAVAINPYGTSAGNTGEIRFFELTANGSNYVGLKSPDSISSNLIWTLPSGDGAASQVLTTNGAGQLSWTTAATDTGWTHSGSYVVLSTSADSVGIGTSTPGSKLDVQGAIRLGTTGANNVLNTSAASGSPTGSLYWGDKVICDSSSNCANAGDIGQVGSMESGIAFGDSTADDDWLGLGASAGRIEFDDQTTDEVNILGANVGIGTSTPGYKLDVAGTLHVSGALTLGTASSADGSIVLAGSTNAYTTTVTSAALTTGSRTLTIPDTGGVDREVCLSSGNCSGTGAGIGGAGTTNKIAKFSGTYALQDSIITDNGTNIGINTAGPDAKLDVLATTEQLRLTYADGTAYTALTTSSGGDLTVAPSGGDVSITGTLAVSGATTLSNLGTGVVQSSSAGLLSSGALNLAGGSSYVTGTLPVANGGTGQTTYTDGQLLIGNSTGNTLTKTTLTQGSGVTITNGSGAITISATGTGGDVTDVTAGSGLTGTNEAGPNVTLTVGQGTGITVNADDVAVNQATAFAWTNAHTYALTPSGTSSADMIALTLTNTTTSGTQRGIAITNANDAANATTESLIFLDNAETTASTLTDALLITSSGVSGGVVDAIDVSAANITNAINVGNNIALFSTIQAAELTNGTLTIEDTSGNDLLTIADAGTTGNVTVTGSLTLGTQLAVGQGGTGATTLTAYGLLYGNGTSMVAAVGPDATTGKCLLSQGSSAAPAWGSCTGAGGGGGVSGVIGTANQVLANGNSGTTETGNVTLTLPQSIGIASTPTFSALTLSAATSLTLGVDSAGGTPATGSIVLKHSTTANTTTLTSAAQSASRTFTLPTVAGNYDICLSIGNCAGSGTGITGAGTTNYIAKFTSGNSLGSSLLFDDDTSIGIADATPDATLDVDSSATTGTAFGITATALTTGKAISVTATNTAVADQAAGLPQILVTSTNAQATAAQTSGSGFNAFKLLFTNNPTIAGNTENVAFIQNAATSNTTDNAVASLLKLDNADTSTSGSTVVTDGIIITNSGAIAGGIIDAIDVSDSTITNAINIGTNTILGTSGVIDFTSFDVDASGNTTAASLILSSALGVAYGGTGATTLTSNGVLYGNGTGVVQDTDAGTSGQLLVANASGVPTFVSLGTDAALSATGALTIASNAVALATDTTGNFVADITAGAGLTGTVATENASANLIIGQGTGITVNADDVAVNTAATFAWTGSHGWTLGASSALTIDAATTDNTTTSGVINLDVDTVTDGNIGSSIDYQVGDAAASLTGVYGQKIDLTVDNDAAHSQVAYGQYIGLTANDASSTTYGLAITAEDAGAQVATAGLLIQNLQATDIDLTDAVLVQATTTDSIVDAFDASDAEITNALNVGQNFLLHSTIRTAELSSGTLTVEDTSGNDLLTIADGGTTGNVTATGTLTAAGLLTGQAGLTASSTITFSGLSSTGIVTNTAAGVLGTTGLGTASYCLKTNSGATAVEWNTCASSSAVDYTGASNTGTIALFSDNDTITASALSQSAGNVTASGDLIVSGNDLTFGNSESISNATDGTLTLTAPTVSTSAALTATGLLTGSAGLTVSGGAISLNASAGTNTTSIGTGNTSGAVTIGGNSNTVAVDSTNWDITTAGAISVAAGQSLDVLTAGALNIGNTTATTVSIGGTAATTLNLGAGGALTRAINIGTGTGVDTISIGTGGTGADAITIGQSLATLGLSSANWSVTTAGAISSAISSATGLTLSGGSSTGILLSGGQSTAINISSASTTIDIQLQNGEYIDNNTDGYISFSSAGTFSGLRSGSTSLTLFDTSTTVSLANGNTATTLNLATGTGADTINVGTGATGADTINIGTGTPTSGTQTITIGSTYASSTISVKTGSSGGVKIGDGGTTNYSTFDSNGALTFAGNARPYSELFLNPKEAIAPAVNGCALSAVTAGSGATPINYQTLDCDDTTSESVSWDFKMPQNYVSGTNIEVTVSWQANVANAAKNATFDVSYVGVASGESWHAASMTAVDGSAVSATGTAYTVQANTITLTSPTIDANDLVSLKVARDVANDDLGADALILKVRLKFLVGS